MKEIAGTSNKYLEINLTTKSYSTFCITENDLKNYIGGKGIGLKLLYEKLDFSIDPFDEKNILAFIMGVVIGSGLPCSGRWEALTKSPLTGIIGTSSCGGPFGMALKKSGYDGVLITGKSEKPLYIIIEENKVEFKDGLRLWGKTTSETQNKLIEIENLSNNDGMCVIGPAGENLILYANIRSGNRYLGRAGFGAVMGSKNLKAIIAKNANYQIKPKNEKLFNKVKTKAVSYINRNFMTSQAFRKYGTTYNVNVCNKHNILPVNNFSYGNSEKAYQVSGEAMCEKYKTTPSTCKPCLILCGHKGTYPDGKVRHIPEYETVGLLGPNLGIFDSDQISKWNDLANEFGLDTISLGGTLACAMELTEKGYLKSNLKFGDPTPIESIISDISYRKGLGEDLANGSKRLAEKFWAKELAIQVKGLELAAYNPTGCYGQALNYSVANRGGCHLSSFVVGMEVIYNYLSPKSILNKEKWVIFFENLWATVNSLQTCQFTGFAYLLEPFIPKYTPKFLLKIAMNFLPDIAILLMDWSVYSDFFKSLTGININQWDLLKAGERIHLLERYINTKMGISKKDDKLPEKLAKDIPLEKMIKKYYKKRHYDENGIPKLNYLKKILKDINLE